MGPHERESKGGAAAVDDEWADAGGDSDSGRGRSGRSAASAVAASRAAAVGDEDALLLAWWAAEAEDTADRADLRRPRIGERPTRKVSLPLEGGVENFGARRCIFGSTIVMGDLPGLKRVRLR